VLLGALLAAHAALVNHFQPFAWLASDQPITGVDYDTHAEQTWRVLEGLRGWGKSWVYDVHLLAGFPNGTIFDADNKLWELWTYALVTLGASKATAFNAFVFLAHLSIVPWMFLVARCFGLSNDRAIVAAAMSSALWLFDSYAHWFWWIGTTAYIFAAYFYLLPLALFYRFARDRKKWRALLVALLMTLAHLLHPYTFFVMVAPMLVIYAGAFRSFSRADHLAVIGVCASVLLGNAYWLGVAARHWHYVLNSAFYGQVTLGFVLADFFNLLKDASTTGYLGTRAAFRWLFLGLALGTLYLWRAARDPRYRLFAFGFAAMFAMAYVAPVVLPAFGQIQPYRFVASAMFLSVIPAAELAGRAWDERSTLFAGPMSRIVVLVLSVTAVQRLSGDVLYFLPGVAPDVPPVRAAPFPITASGFIFHFDYSHPNPKLVDRQLDRWVQDHAREGRIAVSDWTGERLAWSTDAEILGGFVELNLKHARAHPLRWVERNKLTLDELRDYIGTYAVQYFIVRFEDLGLPALGELVEPVTKIGAATVYRSRIPADFFAQGHGRLSAQTNRIAVSDTDPAERIVLKYHWHEALVCNPNCRIERVPHPRDEVGFIAIPAPHPVNFVIENGYKL
jgi:hypothetical protein